MKRPVIGLTPSASSDEKDIFLHRNIMDIFLSLGAAPIILPLTTDIAFLVDEVEMCDAFVITGGGDVDGAYYGEWTRSVSGVISYERDAMEIPLARILHEHPEKPVLGICRGMQVLNVALGGKLYQDIDTDYGTPCIAHRQKQAGVWPSHEVAIHRGSMLSRILEEDLVRVNSLHHQAVKEISPALTVNAAAPDGIIEGFESKTHPFYLGLQWHPEIMGLADPPSGKIFRAFISAIQS